MTAPISEYKEREKIAALSERKLNAFAAAEWKKALPFLQNRFSLSEDDSKDIFQESFIILYNNIRSGKLNKLTSSLSTYFLGICMNKARELQRRSLRIASSDDDTLLDFANAEIRPDKVEELLQLDGDDLSVRERKEAIVRQIVRQLPSPCNELLWGYFRDNLNMKTLAQMYNYSSENSVKVTKHRCQNKFKTHFNSVVDRIFN